MTQKIIKADNESQSLSLESRLNLKEAAYLDKSLSSVIRSDNNNDAADKAKAIVDQALFEADRIKKRAKQIYLEVESKVKEATEKGYAEGHEEGVKALTEMALLMQKKNQELILKLEQEALKLVFEMGRKVIGESFNTSEEALLSVMRGALMASMGNQLTLLVNPVDYQRLQTHESSLMTALHGSQTLIVKSTEAVKPMTCLVESEMGSVEANLENQLSAIRKVLGVP